MYLENNPEFDTIFYDVRAGDSLSGIIKKYYGSVTPPQRQDMISKILLENPEIKNPNLIHPGQILVIDIPRGYSAIPGHLTKPAIAVDKETLDTLKDNLSKAPPEERRLVSALAPISLGSGATTLDIIKHTFKSNTSLLTDMAENYNDFKADKVTKGQYGYHRRSLISKLKSKLGPTSRLLFGSRSPNEVLRISRTKGRVPTHIIKHQANRMINLSRLASKGGVVLSVVGLGVACHEIAKTDDKQQKNEILVESLGGVGGGLLFGAAVTVLIVGTPVGWIAALAIGITGAVTSFTSGKVAEHIYSTSGSKIDFVNDLGVNRICN